MDGMTGREALAHAEWSYSNNIPAGVRSAIEARILAERRYVLAKMERRHPLTISAETLQIAKRRFVESDDAVMQAIALWKQHRSSGKAWVRIDGSYVAVAAIRDRACKAWRMRSAYRVIVIMAEAEHDVQVSAAATRGMHTAVAMILSKAEAI